MRIIITGGTGFIGSRILRSLMTQGHALVVPTRQHEKVTSYDDLSDLYIKKTIDCNNTLSYVWCNLDNERQVRDLLFAVRPDVILHFAGNPSTKLDADYPCKIIHDNILATSYLLAYAPNGCRFINASSITVYGDFVGLPDEGTVTNPKSIYSATKLASEALVDAYTSLAKVVGVSLRMCAIVGSGAKHGLLPDLVRKIKSPDKTLKLIGAEPGSIKPYVHVSDVVQLANDLIHNNRVGAYNICANESISVKEAAQIAMKTIGISKEVEWSGQSWIGDNPVIQASNRLAADMLKWRPSYTSAAAVEKAITELD